MAVFNNGVVKVTEAKDALIAAGVLKKTKYSWSVVNTTLSRAKEFEKDHAQNGTYRFLNMQQPQLAAAS
jgi:hypothetical protein